MTFSSKLYNEGWHKWDDTRIYNSTVRHMRRFVFSIEHIMSV